MCTLRQLVIVKIRGHFQVLIQFALWAIIYWLTSFKMPFRKTMPQHLYHLLWSQYTPNSKVSKSTCQRLTEHVIPSLKSFHGLVTGDLGCPLLKLCLALRGIGFLCVLVSKAFSHLSKANSVNRGYCGLQGHLNFGPFQVGSPALSPYLSNPTQIPYWN